MNDLQALLNPASIAVIGASERGPGLNVLRNLKEMGYPGRVYPINPKYPSIAELPCYPGLSDIPGSVDCAFILLSEQGVNDALRDCGEKGVRAAVVLASGFAEVGGSGRDLQGGLESICREYGMWVCGPNCLGLINLHGRAPLYASRIPDSLVAGNVGVIAQSGAVCISFVYNDRGLGLSYLISAGNEAVVQTADYMEALLECPNTRVIAAFLEEIRNPQKVLDTARTAQAVGKPIVVLKVGRSARGKRAASSHTGSLAGNHEVCVAALKQHGVIVVEDLDEMMETLLVLSKHPIPERPAKGAGIITASGGEITLLLDLAEEVGLALPDLSTETKTSLGRILPPYTRPSNPLDATQVGIRDTDFYKECLRKLAGDENLACIAVGQDCPANGERAGMGHFRELAEAAVDVSKESDVPLVFFSNTSGAFHAEVVRILGEGGLPLLQGSRESLLAIRNFLGLAARLSETPAAKTASPGGSVPLPFALPEPGGRMLSYPESESLLGAYDIPLAKAKVCTSVTEALQAADEIGFPVAVKAVSDQISHKTEAGGVILDVRNRRQLRQAIRQIRENVERSTPGAAVDALLVQEMLSGGLEVIVGLSRDETFGPTVMVGLGGVWVELFRDVAFRLPPLRPGDIDAMLKEIRGYRLLEGFRGGARKDVDSLVDVLFKVSRLAEDHGTRIAGLDLNPLFVGEEGQGVKAVDFRVELA